ncbi:hypothetical protein LX36DRAFT_372112 [Colletotrichum falcatum]|nr:hypothetical protein LX36DRAFT_372112 [Colletotrichum falcatum]
MQKTNGPVGPNMGVPRGGIEPPIFSCHQSTSETLYHLANKACLAGPSPDAYFAGAEYGNMIRLRDCSCGGGKEGPRPSNGRICSGGSARGQRQPPARGVEARGIKAWLSLGPPGRMRDLPFEQGFPRRDSPSCQTFSLTTGRALIAPSRGSCFCLSLDAPVGWRLVRSPIP